MELEPELEQYLRDNNLTLVKQREFRYKDILHQYYTLTIGSISVLVIQSSYNEFSFLDLVKLFHIFIKDFSKEISFERECVQWETEKYGKVEFYYGGEELGLDIFTDSAEEKTVIRTTNYMDIVDQLNKLI